MMLSRSIQLLSGVGLGDLDLQGHAGCAALVSIDKTDVGECRMMGFGNEFAIILVSPTILHRIEALDTMVPFVASTSPLNRR
jgi:hypothetical protein